LTEHDDVITPLLRGAPRLGLALGPALARAGPYYDVIAHTPHERLNYTIFDKITPL